MAASASGSISALGSLRCLVGIGPKLSPEGSLSGKSDLSRDSSPVLSEIRLTLDCISRHDSQTYKGLRTGERPGGSCQSGCSGSEHLCDYCTIR